MSAGEGQQPAVGAVPPRLTRADEVPRPRPPLTPIGHANAYPPPPEQGDDRALAWAQYAADLFRARADWRMSRTAAAISQALAAAAELERDDDW